TQPTTHNGVRNFFQFSHFLAYLFENLFSPRSHGPGGSVNERRKISVLDIANSGSVFTNLFLFAFAIELCWGKGRVAFGKGGNHLYIKIRLPHPRPKSNTFHIASCFIILVS